MRILYLFYRLGGMVSAQLRRRVTPAGWFLLGCLVVSGVGAIDAINSVHYQIFAFLGMLVLGSAVFCAVGYRGRLRAERQLPRHATAGYPVRYRAVVRNEGRFGLRGARLREWLAPVFPSAREFLEREEPFERERNLFDRVFVYYRWMWLTELRRPARFRLSEAFSVGRGKARAVELEFTPLRRGVLRFGDLRVITTDPLGLFMRTRRVPAPCSGLVVLPRRYRLPDLALPGAARQDVGGKVASAGVGHSDEFVSLRDYRPGDPRRHIHWRSWARLGRPVVKEFEDETFPRYGLVLDTLWTRGSAERFEEAVSVAASFAFAIDTKESFLDLLFVGSRAFSFSAGGQSGGRETEKMLEVLAGVEPVGDPGALPQLAAEVQRRAAELSGCIFVFLDWDAARREIVTAVRNLGVACLTLVLEEEGREPEPGVQWLRVGRVQEDLWNLRFPE